jgi:hypothetical protein
MLLHLAGLLDPVLNSQVTGAKPLQVQKAMDRFQRAGALKTQTLIPALSSTSKRRLTFSNNSFVAFIANKAHIAMPTKEKPS